MNSYFKIILRHFLKYRMFSMVNIIGLTLGLSCFTIILLFLENELSYDRFHRNPESVYRVVKDFVNPDGTKIPDATTPPALSYALRSEVSEVERVTRFSPNRGRLYLLQYGEKRFYETELIRVDSSFFSVFDFPFVSGNKRNALDQLHSILLTERAAEKYFGDEDPLGKTLRMNLNGGTDFIVTGLLEDVPQNSHFSFDLIIPFESGRNPDLEWNWNGFYTYARLKDGTNPAVFESHVKDLVKKYQPDNLDEFYIQKMTDIHLYSKLKWELSVNGDILNVRILMTIALFVVLLAGINYVNLVTAQSARRAKEVGIRKVTGAYRHKLILQFLTESFITVLFSLCLSIILTTLLLPVTRQILGYDLSAFFAHSHYVKFLLPACALLIGILAGLYPAFYLSSFEPLKVLRGSFVHSGAGVQLRRGLVVFQFVVSTALSIGALIVSGQLDFMKDKNPGFNENHVLLLPNVRGGIGAPPQIAGDKIDEMKTLPGVISIARADGVLGFTNAINGVSVDNGNHIALNFMRVDHEFLPTLQLELTEGRNFSDQFISDENGIILNERAVKQLGLKEPFIGQHLKWDAENGNNREVTVIGIVKDFHFTSMREAIRPFGFILEIGNGSTFFLKLHPQNLDRTLLDIEKVWHKYNPENPFEYSFQDQYLAKLNLAEARFQKLFSYFTLLAIVIACLGLFGLVTYLTEAKTKEIGIRKVLGASVNTIIMLLSGEFLLMILIAISIASPIAFFLMKNWLRNFAYRVEIDWQVFVFAGVVSVLIALATISLQAIGAALANPVDSLRNE